MSSSASRIEYSEKYADDMNEYRWVSAEINNEGLTARKKCWPRETCTMVYVDEWWTILISFLAMINRVSNMLGFFKIQSTPLIEFFTQSRHSSEGAREDATQEPSLVGIRMARHRCPTKSRMATLCHSPVSRAKQIRRDRPTNSRLSCSAETSS
jgi:hypothetical protein